MKMVDITVESAKMDKKEAIKIIYDIQTGGGTPNRDSYPKEWRGECAEWMNPMFHLGMEYGYILALMHTFNITKKEVDNYVK